LKNGINLIIKAKRLERDKALKKLPVLELAGKLAAHSSTHTRATKKGSHTFGLIA
jgi:hypothetical protein